VETAALDAEELDAAVMLTVTINHTSEACKSDM
jgi:hypothetical protein